MTTLLDQEEFHTFFIYPTPMRSGFTPGTEARSDCILQLSPTFPLRTGVWLFLLHGTRWLSSQFSRVFRFHDVEEVFVDKERMSISGWFHIPQKGEPDFIEGELEATEAKSSLQQLESAEVQEYDFPKRTRTC